MKTRISSFGRWYNSQTKALAGKNKYVFCIANYTLLFLILQALVFSAFFISGKSFVIQHDGISQHYPRMLYISNAIQGTIKDLFSGNGITFPLFDFRQSIASRNLTWFCTPEILSMFFSDSHMDVLYTLIVIGAYYLVGLSFIIFMLHFNIDCISSIIGAIVYCFCGFGLKGIVRHPAFSLPMMNLPILLLGIEFILHKKNGILLLVVTMVSMMQSIYFSCMQAILCFIYAIVRFFDVYKSNRIRMFVSYIGSLFVWVGIAGLLSGVIVVPTLCSMLDSGRVGKNIFQYVNPFLYHQNFYERFLSYFLSESNGTGGYSRWTMLGFSVLSVPAVGLLFSRHKKEERSLRIMFLVLTVMLCVPMVSYVMSGFSNLTNRFVYAYSLCVSMIIATMVSKLKEIRKKEIIITGIILIIYIILCETIVSVDNRRSEAIFFMIVSLLMLLLIYLIGHRVFSLKLMCLLVVCTSVIYSANELYSSAQSNYVEDFISDPETIYKNNQYHSLSESKIVSDDNSFFRASGNALKVDDLNMSFSYGIKDLTGYPSIGASSLYINWLKELEVPHIGFYQQFWGLNSRASLLNLTSNKYYAVRESEGSFVPFGYSETDHITTEQGDNDRIYINTNWIPVGFTYDNYLIRNEYDQMTALEKQEVQLQAAVVDQSPTSETISPIKPILTSVIIPNEITHYDSVAIGEGKIRVKNEGGKIILSIKGLPRSETYLRIVGLDLTNGTSERVWDVTAESDKGNKSKARFYTDYYVYSHMQHTQILNLGYSEEPVSQITLTFSAKGTCLFDGFEVYCQPMDSFADQVSKLKREALENVTTTGNSLEGSINVSKDKILCVSIPYNDDWKVYVDEKDAELLHINTAYMGVELSKGQHTVKFVYHMRGLKAGIILSSIGILCLVVVLIYIHKQKRTPGKKSGINL